MPRPADFRYYYANAFTFGMTDHDMRIVFAIAENPSEPQESVDQAGINMSLKTAKLLQFLINGAIGRFERITGSEIQIDEAKLETLRKLMGLDDNLTPVPPSSIVPQQQP